MLTHYYNMTWKFLNTKMHKFCWIQWYHQFLSSELLCIHARFKWYTYGMLPLFAACNKDTAPECAHSVVGGASSVVGGLVLKHIIETNIWIFIDNLYDIDLFFQHVRILLRNVLGGGSRAGVTGAHLWWTLFVPIPGVPALHVSNFEVY